jgi:IS30 family transposase
MALGKKYYKVIIVDADNRWVATGGNTTMKEAIDNYKKEDKGEFTYDKGTEYYAFSISRSSDEEYFGGEE